jgi:hypothetical protein
MKLDGKDRARVLSYAAGYLEDKDRTIADDAYREFLQSPDKAIGEAAKKMSAKQLRGWVEDKETPSDRLRLYGFLLGNCGGDEDAKALRALSDRLRKQERPPLTDGILTGYTLLKPEEGWVYVRALMKDPAAPFLVRFSCLRAARYFRTTRPDVIGDKETLELVNQGLDQADVADIPIGWLGKWGCWDLTGRILPLYGQKDYDEPLMRRAIIRYALQCPGKAAAEFVAARRKDDPEQVELIEEALRFEQEAAKK